MYRHSFLQLNLRFDRVAKVRYVSVFHLTYPSWDNTAHVHQNGVLFLYQPKVWLKCFVQEVSLGESFYGGLAQKRTYLEFPWIFVLVRVEVLKRQMNGTCVNSHYSIKRAYISNNTPFHHTGALRWAVTATRPAILVFMTQPNKLKNCGET